MQTIIFCGGKSERLRNHDSELPKPLWKIGEKPILWHVMQLYAQQGFKDFILCTGYKKEEIERYFATEAEPGWSIQFDYAGEDAGTADRLKSAMKFVDSEYFFCNYADGLSDIDLTLLQQAHVQSGKTATLTAVKPQLPYGVLETNEHNAVVAFHEKPVSEHWLNGGYFVFSSNIEKYLVANDMLEKGTFESLLPEAQLNAYLHHGKWQCMDTYKDYVLLNKIMESGTAFWLR